MLLSILISLLLHFLSLSPTDGATNVSTTANLVLTFNENVKSSYQLPEQQTNYLFRIYKTTGDVLVETIDQVIC